MGEISSRRVPKEEVDLLSADPRKDLQSPLKNMFLEYLHLEKMLFGLGKRNASDRTVYEVFKIDDFEGVPWYDAMDFTSEGIPFIDKMVYSKLLSYELLRKTLLERGVIETTDGVVKSELAMNGLDRNMDSIDYRSLTPEAQYKFVPRMIEQYEKAKSSWVAAAVKKIYDSLPKSDPKEEDQKPEISSYDGKRLHELIERPEGDVRWAYQKLFHGQGRINLRHKKSLGGNFKGIPLYTTELSTFQVSYGDDMSVRYSELNADDEPRAEKLLIDEHGTVTVSNENEIGLVKAIALAVYSEVNYTADVKKYLGKYHGGETVQPIETDMVARCRRDLGGIGWLGSRMNEADYLLRNVLGQESLPENPYQTLGVGPESNRKEILKAFYTKVKSIHPDMRKPEEKELYHKEFVQHFEQLVKAKDYLLSSKGVQKAATSDLLRYIGAPSEIPELNIRPSSPN